MIRRSLLLVVLALYTAFAAGPFLCSRERVRRY